MLLFDEKMLLPICRDEPPFGLDEDTVAEDQEVWDVLRFPLGPDVFNLVALVLEDSPHLFQIGRCGRLELASHYSTLAVGPLFLGVQKITPWTTLSTFWSVYLQTCGATIRSMSSSLSGIQRTVMVLSGR